MYRNILVAIDGSPAAEVGREHATALALALHARLTVLSVVPEIPGFVVRATVDVGALEREAQEEAERLVRDAVDAAPPELPVTRVVRLGRVPDQILAQIEEGDHDLVVLGTRGRGALASTLLGSVGAAVHAHAHVPLLVVHP